MPKQLDHPYFFEYLESQQECFHGVLFYTLIMLAMRDADNANLEKLMDAWPEVWAALKARHNAPGGALSENELAYVRKLRGCD